MDPGTRPIGTQPTSSQKISTQTSGTQNTITQSNGMSQEYWEKLDRRATSSIRFCLVDLVLFNMSGESTTKELWDTLGTFYQSPLFKNQLLQ